MSNNNFIYTILFIIFIFLLMSNKIVKETFENIPRNVFILWEKNLPPIMSKNITKIKNQNPDFLIQIKDENECYNFIKKNFPDETFKAYSCLIPKAYKSDLARLCFLYILGGIYIDAKFAIPTNISLSSISNQEHFVQDIPKSGSGIYNGFIVSKPKNSEILSVINQITKNVKEKYKGDSSLDITGPNLHKKYITKNIDFNLIDNNSKVKILDKNGNVLLYEYPEYRMEQEKYGHGERYNDLWLKDNIYSC